eukprot:12423642-Karenia_brevis.AAC.1
MAALKLITSNDRHCLRMSWSNGATCCHCPPFWQAEMAALKLITLAGRPSLRISSSKGATRCQ